MGCVFCATGQLGFSRNLSTGEIVEQVYRFSPGGRTATNVVLMGMGEPLANYDATLRAVRLLNHPLGQNLAARRITVSTSGLVPQIRRLAEEGLQVTLAVSLHAPNDELRTRLMPVNRRWPIAEVLDAARTYVERTGRRVSFEYTLIAGVNDSPALARELAARLAGLLCHVNLIPYNPTEHQALEGSSPEQVLRFARVVQQAGIPCTIRVNRGRDILAACGQLRLAERRRPVAAGQS